jgi:hypothetical protein
MMCIILIILLFNSCKKENKNVIDLITEESIVEKIEVSITKTTPFVTPIIEEDSENIINLITKYIRENYFRHDYFELFFLKKVNMGIPGGDNYIVVWKDLSENRIRNILFVYSISDKIEKSISMGLGIIDPRRETSFNIMHDIPGIHIPETGLSIYDINKDGFDDLIGYIFTGLGDYIGIYSYDQSKEKIVNYSEDVYFELVDYSNGPPPLEFLNYNGMDGFKVFSWFIPGIQTINLINDIYAWYFYSWNPEVNKYTVISEYYINNQNKEYSIYNFPREHFEKRINNWISDSPQIVEEIIEIEPAEKGGRSFYIRLRVYDGTFTEDYFHYDSLGVRIFR